MRWMWTMMAAFPLAACGGIASGSDSGSHVQASGSGTTRSFQVAGFDKVELRGFDDVDVRVGPSFSVSADGPSAELDRLDIRKDGAVLKVGRQREDGGFNWGGREHKGVKVHVTLPRLAGASVAGSGNMTVDKVSGGDFDASIAGSGDLSIGQLAVNSADLSIAGSGDLTLKGQASRAKVSIAGSGSMQGAGFRAASANVAVAGSGDVRADVTGPADVSLMGSGDVDLGAGAKCSTNKMGSGEVRCGG